MLAERLDHLFATVHPAGRGPYSLREAADAINAKAGAQLVSAAYLSQLRSGQRTEPSHSRLAAIADFFGVNALYFTADAARAGETDRQLDALAAMRDAGVRRVALRSSGISEQGLEAVLSMIEHVRRLEGLPPDDGQAADGAAGG
jgi:transcriptional regulator with XRE-family HTH domain